MKARVEQLFHEVVELSPEARARYLAEHEIDEETRLEVEELIRFDGNTNTSLLADIGRIAGRALGSFEGEGRRCGPYRLGTLLGQGGMGSVYAAERVDGELTRKVAVKLLRPGADSPELRRRFLAERQILASLSHPNIARLLDAGHCEEGQPYLVMEYVEGQPIDRYAEGLGIRQKVEVFRKVCAAAGYLHRNLVVHRDLKPSNILVTGEGEPRLLDFGIARMLDLSADATLTGMRMLTLDYASPEQVSGGVLSTATDIYSLGAVLYKLLTGTSPHRQGGDSPAAAAVVAGQVAPPRKIAPGLDSDLEMIAMKALRKEPGERYTTVEQLAEDLDNYLASRPIRAREGDTWYRARKFARRYWLPAAAATLALGGLAAGVVIANQQRAIAQHRFVQVRQLAGKLFDIDDVAANIPGNTKVRAQIVDTSLDYLRRLAAEVHGDPELSLEIGNAYLRVARVQGVPINPNLGQFNQAEESLRQADAFIATALASDPGDRRALLASAKIAHDRTVLANFRHQLEPVRVYGPKAAAQMDRLLQQGLPEGTEIQSVVKIYDNVAVAFLNQHFYQDAIRYGRRALEVARLLNAGPAASFPLGLLANAYRQTGDLDAALSAIQESRTGIERAMAARAAGIHWTDLYSALFREGLILGQDQGISLNRPAEAAAAFQRAVDLAEEAAKKDPDDYGSRDFASVAGRQLANVLRHSDPGHALAVYDHSLLRIREVKNNVKARRDEARSLTQSAYALRSLHRPQEARQRIDAALRLLHDTGDYPAKETKLTSEDTIARVPWPITMPIQASRKRPWIFTGTCCKGSWNPSQTRKTICRMPPISPISMNRMPGSSGAPDVLPTPRRSMHAARLYGTNGTESCPTIPTSAVD